MSSLERTGVAVLGVVFATSSCEQGQIKEEGRIDSSKQICQKATEEGHGPTEGRKAAINKTGPRKDLYLY